jgi:hypothetical protein
LAPPLVTREGWGTRGVAYQAFSYFAELVTRFVARAVHFGLMGQPMDQKPGPSLTQNFKRKKLIYLPQLSRILAIVMKTLRLKT